MVRITPAAVLISGVQRRFFVYKAGIILWSVNNPDNPAASYATGLFNNGMSGIWAYDAAAIF
ncbi:hypothetical protein DSF71_25290 [Salmonella enterica subsp. enterica serovar Hvittingfoss]|nr:hypothetical protein [Salmonella enterica]EBS2928649.1 hypothetical protein [Salmonella enterica subsp. enterica serovar Hvittingfoss]EBX7470072.1 hypothetical protein [Salmonella enterica subsp. enterica serovar Bareilly]ECA5828722.1 hypothetical protein [Salmonella enterica subsp. enterica serovar Hvittingfoss]